MWTNLQSIHKSKSHLVLTMHLHTLMMTITTEESDITEHLTKLKNCWDQLSLFGDTNYRISEFLFKCIIVSSLPESWDQYTDQFVAGQLDFVDTDPRKHVDIQQFIDFIKQEYKHRLSRKSRVVKTPEQALYVQCNNAKALLTSCISGNASNQRHFSSSPMYCKICKCTNHDASKCWYRGKPKCKDCSMLGHTADKCWQMGKNGNASNSGGNRNNYHSRRRP